MIPAPALLEFKAISVMRGTKLALNRLDLVIQSGEHVAILGPNGCGKSTLIKTITRECYPLSQDGSSLTIMGRRSWNIFDLRSHLGIVANDFEPTRVHELTGREVVLSGFFSSMGIWPHQHVSPEMRDKAEQVLDWLEALHLGDRPIAEMSSGEARRIWIGRALVHDPQTLLLDEPTNSLDMRASHEVREMMRKLAQAGTGILLVTHHLSEIVPEIGRVILMRGGTIFADGPKDQVLTLDNLSSVFGVGIELAQRNGYYHVW